MRDALGHMFYMNGTGIIHCKIIDGVRYPLDPRVRGHDGLGRATTRDR